MTLRRVFAAGLSAWICVCVSSAAAADLPKMILDAAQDSVKTYKVAGVTLTIRKVPGKEVPVAQLTISSPGARPLTMLGQEGSESAAANLGVGKLDPRNPVPQVIFSTYSGGAHCCGRILIGALVKGAWRKIDLGLWDGDMIGEFPHDVDGDGISDLALNDNAFLYAFDCYACSWPPPQIFNIVAGKARDVSTAPRYAKLFRDEMARARAECAKHTNGACAGFVADAARLGRFDEAWTFMLANYDRKAAVGDMPKRCRGKIVAYQCKDGERTPRDYPQALHWFLEDHGYIAQAR